MSRLETTLDFMQPSFLKGKSKNIFREYANIYGLNLRVKALARQRA